MALASLPNRFQLHSNAFGSQEELPRQLQQCPPELKLASVERPERRFAPCDHVEGIVMSPSNMRASIQSRSRDSTQANVSTSVSSRRWQTQPNDLGFRLHGVGPGSVRLAQIESITPLLADCEKLFAGLTASGIGIAASFEASPPAAHFENQLSQQQRPTELLSHLANRLLGGTLSPSSAAHRLASSGRACLVRIA